MLIDLAFDPHAPRQYGVRCFFVRMLHVWVSKRSIIIWDIWMYRCISTANIKGAKLTNHYENTTMQYTEIFQVVKLKKKSVENL